jgi:hypothetical protein
MASSKLAFHVRQDATPNRVEGVLMAVAQVDASLSYDLIYERARGLGYDLNNRKEPIVLLKDLGILERKSCLPTQLGADLHCLLVSKPSAFLEAMHVLHYTSWSPKAPAINCFSWSYRTMCDLLHELGSSVVNRKSLVSEISEQAMSYFDTNRVSFGSSSIDGILHWLRALNPPVLSNSQTDGPFQIVFTSRTFCPPETFVLAVDYLYQVEGADYQSNLLLDPDKQATICKVCLLDPTAFDASFEWAVGQYDFLQRGTRGGWGSYVLLTRQPRITDFTG